MMRWKTLATTFLLFTALTGCSLANRLVYRIDINQGNYLEQSIIEDIRFGMTKEQIHYLLGPPTVVDASQPELWYYIHWLKPGHKNPEQKTLELYFDSQELLVEIKGDFKPSAHFFER